jgi:hypothetical protein
MHIHTMFGDVPIGDAANGLCGGMAFVVRDLFEAKRLPPVTHENPDASSPAFTYIVARLFDSFNLPLGVTQYYEWMQLPTHNTWIGPTGTSWRTIKDSMPVVRTTIDSGHPCPLALVCIHSANPGDLGQNHQVLAYAYEDNGPTTRVHLYDSNHPDTDVTITFDHTNPEHTTAFAYSTGDHNVLGFFPVPYGAKNPADMFQDGRPAVGILSPSGHAADGGDPIVSGTVPVQIRAPRASSVDVTAYYATDPSDISTVAWRTLGSATYQGGDTYSYQFDSTKIVNQGDHGWGTVNIAATPTYDGQVAPPDQRFYELVRINNVVAPPPPIRLPDQPGRVPLDVVPMDPVELPADGRHPVRPPR